MGLMFGPSRKQTDYFKQRTGPIKRNEEKKETRVAASQNLTYALAQDVTLISAPTGMKGTLIGYALFERFSNTGTTDVSIVIDGTNLFFYRGQSTSNLFQDKWNYEEGIVFYNNVRFVSTAPTAGNAGYSIEITYTTEPAGEGWY
jgi:hypothetical protein